MSPSKLRSQLKHQKKRAIDRGKFYTPPKWVKEALQGTVRSGGYRGR